MPRLRLLADAASGQASGISGAAVDGDLEYDVASGDVVPVVLDATGWAGADSVTGSDWDATPGVTISFPALAGNVASCNAYVPNAGWGWSAMHFPIGA